MNFNLKLGPFSISLGKSLSPDLAGWMVGNDVDTQGNGAKLSQPYMQSAWIYTAVSLIADNIANVPFRISNVGAGKGRRIRALRDSSDPRHRSEVRRALGETLVDSGPVVDLFNAPHPTMNRTLFWELVASWDAQRGEFFIVPLDAADNPVDLKDRAPQVQRLITLPTEMFWHMVVGYDLQGWRYTGSPLMSPIPSEILLPSEVIHSRNVNPYLFWRGLSPLFVANVAAQSDYAAGKFMQGLMMNNADTGIILESDHPLSKEQLDQALAQLKERKRKAGTPDRPMALSGLRVAKPTISNVDMEFLNNRKWSRDEMFAIWKVPPSLAGFTDSKKELGGGGGAGINTEKLTFIEQTITPKCRRIEAAIAPIVTTFGEDLIGWFDIESLPVMQEARRARAETAVKFFGMGVPFGDINKNFDLGFPDHPWHQKGWLPFSIQDAGTIGSEPPPSEDMPPPAGEETEKPGEETEAEKSNPFARLSKLLESAKATPAAAAPRTTPKQLWEKHVAARKKSVKLFATKTRKVMFEFRSKTLAKLSAIHLESATVDGATKTVVAPADNAEKRSLIDLIFNAHDFGNHLRIALNAPIRATLEAAAGELLEEIGSKDPWKMPPKEVTDYIARRDQPILGTGQTVRNQLNTAIEEGLNNGESTTQIADRIRATFNKLMGGSDEIGTSESLRIAQTEVNTAFNHSRTLAMDAAGIEYKAWLSSHGPTVRETHEEAEDRYIDNPIPISEPFEVGGYLLMYPGDDSMGAPPGEIINCHCIQLAAEKEGEDEKTIRFKVFGVGVLAWKKMGDGSLKLEV